MLSSFLSGFSLSTIFLLLLSSSIFSFLSIFCCSIWVSPTFSGFNSFSSLISVCSFIFLSSSFISLSFSSFDKIASFSLFVGSSSFFSSVNSVISFSFLGSSFFISSESFSTFNSSFVSSFFITISLVLGLPFLPFNLLETISPSGGWVSSSFISTILSSFISSFLIGSSFVSSISISFFGSLCGFNSISLVSFSLSFISISFITGFSSSKFFKAFSLIKFLSFSFLEYPFLIKLTNLLYLFFCSLFFAFSFIDSKTFCLSFSSKLLIVSAISFIFFSTVLIFLYLSTESSGSSSKLSKFL